MIIRLLPVVAENLVILSDIEHFSSDDSKNVLSNAINPSFGSDTVRFS